MPAAFARSAINAPTFAAASLLPVLPAVRNAASSVDARHQHARAFRRDDLRVDVPRRAMHAQPRRTQFAHLHPAAARAAHACLSSSRSSLLSALLLLRFFAHDALVGVSTPLPLYGSGGRNPRISDATWPTSCLSTPLTITSVWLGVSALMPSGSLYCTGCEKPSCRSSRPPCRLRAITDALQFELLREPLRDAVHHVAARARATCRPSLANADRRARAVKRSRSSSRVISTASSTAHRQSCPWSLSRAACSASSVTSTPFGTSIG